MKKKTNKTIKVKLKSLFGSASVINLSHHKQG